MNIFALSDSPILAAQWQHDRHVNKMTVESAQLLSAVCHGDEYFHRLLEKHHVQMLYKISHKNNPLTLWAGASKYNFAWLALHGLALVAEKHRRFPLNGMHSSYPLLVGFGVVAAKLAGVERVWTRDTMRNLVIDPELMDLASHHSPFIQCMPDEYKGFDSVDAYQRFYLAEKIFQDHVKWTNCDFLPPFITKCVFPESQRIEDRITALCNAHAEGQRLAAMPRDPHPDLLKPANPKAITRFGIRK